jgi:hypothetical protein
MTVTPRGDTAIVTTQLRLVEGLLEHPSERSGLHASATRPVPRRRTRARVVQTRRGRAPRVGDWALDARTRDVGRAGVAAARRRLEAAHAVTGLSRAS